MNPRVSYSVFRIFFTLSFTFFTSCVLSYIYTFFIIKKFKEAESKIEKAIIAALTPGLTLPLTAIAKYILLRKCLEIISADRTFVLCYFLRGGSIVLYRIMQSDFQDFWLFVGLSLLHGASNILSKATLHFRIKIWKSFIACFNKVWCGPTLEIQPLDSPRIRRLNADLEIQNILFEYSTVILSHVYLACYLVVSYEVSPWPIMKDSLIRIVTSLGIDFVSNLLTVFIQVHFCNIPMQKVWQKYWRRHVTANALMIIIYVTYFANSMIHVFADSKYTLKIKEKYKLRNCTTLLF